VDLSLPYLAGFFDGEGSIGIYFGGAGGRTLRCQVTQTATPESTRLLNACRDQWGGSVSPFNRSLRRSAWNWQTSGTTALRFLCDIRPWLVLKAAQADIAINWQRTKPPPGRGPDGRMLPTLPEVIARHDQAAQALVALKKDIDVVMADAADLVTIRHTLHQIVNVKGD
jgi:hypothetical protein